MDRQLCIATLSRPGLAHNFLQSLNQYQATDNSQYDLVTSFISGKSYSSALISLGLLNGITVVRARA